MKHRKTFEAVLANCDDQVVVRDILRVVLTREQQGEVVTLFNEYVDSKNTLKVDEL
jgi:hypothetical protein